MSEMRVGNNSPSSYSGYSGGYSSGPTYVTKSLTLPEAIRAVVDGKLEMNCFVAQLPHELQRFLDDTASAAFGSTSFSFMGRDEQQRLLKDLLLAITRLEYESNARKQAAAKAEAAAREEQQRREQEERLRQQRAAETAAHEESLARQRRLEQEADKRRIAEEEQKILQARASRNAARKQRRLNAKNTGETHDSHHSSAGFLPRIVSSTRWLITTIIALVSILSLVPRHD